MLPFIIGGAVVGTALLYHLLTDFSEEPDLSHLGGRNIFQGQMVEYQSDEKYPNLLKGRITRSVNLIIQNFEGFKIGKTGNPKRRNSEHHKYDYMYLLCESDSKEVIEKFEDYFNKKYISFENNDNKREGSAGPIVAKQDKYYLYVAVRGCKEVDKLPNKK